MAFFPGLATQRAVPVLYASVRVRCIAELWAAASESRDTDRGVMSTPTPLITYARRIFISDLVCATVNSTCFVEAN